MNRSGHPGLCVLDRRWLTIISLLFIVHSVGAATTVIPRLPRYRAGESAESEIVSPVTLVLKNAPEKLGNKADYPIRVFLYSPDAASEAETRLRQAINQIRTTFLEDLYVASKHRVLTPEQTKHPGFERLVAWFQKKHPDFPLSFELAQSWAMAVSDDTFQEQLTSRLRSSMHGYVAAALPDQTRQVRLVPTTAERAITWEEAEKVAITPSASKFKSLAQARANLVRGFGGKYQDFGSFVAQFVRENCVFDLLLTRAVAERPPIPTERTYQPGQIIVHQGETVDANALAAIELLRTMRGRLDRAEAIRQWQDRLYATGTEINGLCLRTLSSLHLIWLNHPIGFTTVSAALVLLLGAGLLRGRGKAAQSTRVIGKEPAYTVIFNAARNETIFLPVKTESSPRLIVRDRATLAPEEDVAEQSEPVLAVDLEWQNRVISAEKRAEALLADVRAGLAPHLAKELMNELVRKLVADREGLMQANHIAASEVARLERRFSRLHADLQQQLRDYQLRTVELQKQLQARTEQNRELLRSQIEALQKKVQ
jgi:hypothetical protein